MHGLAPELAAGHANHSFCRSSRYSAASLGFQSAPNAGSTQRPHSTATRYVIPTVYRCGPLRGRSGYTETSDMKQDASYYDGKEATLVYIAKRRRDALRLESIFAHAGVDYGVEADQYRGGVIFSSLRTGAF